MSMLAERRTKRKWCLNPTGKDWSNDNNKFGQRMLEKMGWKKGCGLGVNLQGMKEHVRVSAKNDTKGLGCKNDSEGEWIHHQQNFENLLAELSCASFDGTRPTRPIETKPVSLEEKSKKSRVRVHYQKFTRGKDVSRYSANDLACIFGKKNNSLDKKTVDMMLYSCHVNTRSNSEADSRSCMISDERRVGQSSDSCEGTSNYMEVLPGFSPLVLPKCKKKDQLKHYRCDDTEMQEKQNYILKEISNVNEIFVPDMDIEQELKCVMEGNSAGHIWSEKIKGKRKKKHIKDSVNNQEITETTVLSLEKEMNESEVVADEVEEMDEFEREGKKIKKKKKDKKNKAKLEDNENWKEDKEIYGTAIEVESDTKGPGNKEYEHASVIGEAETGGFRIKRKKMYEVCNPHISEEHKGVSEGKKNKTKRYTQTLNEAEVSVNVTSDIADLSSQDDRAVENGSLVEHMDLRVSFSSHKEIPPQYDSDSAVKQKKKRHRKNMEVSFRGSNLESILGYGSLQVSHVNSI